MDEWDRAGQTGWPGQRCMPFPKSNGIKQVKINMFPTARTVLTIIQILKICTHNVFT